MPGIHRLDGSLRSALFFAGKHPARKIKKDANLFRVGAFAAEN